MCRVWWFLAARKGGVCEDWEHDNDSDYSHNGNCDTIVVALSFTSEVVEPLPAAAAAAAAAAVKGNSAYHHHHHYEHYHSNNNNNNIFTMCLLYRITQP